MKTKTEIYSIRFNHLRTATDIFCTTYTLGAAVLIGNTVRTPTKITIEPSGKRITTFFDDDTSHTLALTDDIEIFKRIINGKTNKTTN